MITADYRGGGVQNGQKSNGIICERSQNTILKYYSCSIVFLWQTKFISSHNFVDKIFLALFQSSFVLSKSLENQYWVQLSNTRNYL